MTLTSTPAIGSAVSPARLAEAHRAAAKYYADTLASRHGAGPRHYLADRGLAWAAAQPGQPAKSGDAAWVIGYAPPGWTALVGDLRTRGFTDTELLAAGLAITTRRGTIIDRFRDRIMLGLHDPGTPPGGRLVGFIGRAAPATVRTNATVPKYLNTPRTVVFDKSRILFGLAEQRQHLVRGAVPVLVEGPLDVLAVASAAARSRDDESAYVAVAPCGTALTPGHISALTGALGDTPGTGGQVVVAFDADDAGARAARAAYPLLAPVFGDVRAAHLPPGDDPASLATTDPSRLTTALSGAGPLVEDLVDHVLDSYGPTLANAEARVCALREAMRLVAGLPPREVSRQVARTATRLGFPVTLASHELADAATRPGRPAVNPGVSTPGPRGRDLSTPSDPHRVVPSRARAARPGPALGPE